jgi:hypothetical protein
VKALKRYPLPAAQVLDLLVRLGSLEVAPGHGVWNLRDRPLEQLAVKLAEKARTKRPPRRDRPEGSRSSRVGGIDQVRRSGADGVQLAGAAERPLVNKGHALEGLQYAGRRLVPIDMDSFCKERLAIPSQTEPRSRGGTRSAIGVGTARQKHIAMGEVRDEVCGGLEAARRMATDIAIFTDDRYRRDHLSNAVRHKRKGCFDDDGQLQATPKPPKEKAAGRGSVGEDGREAHERWSWVREGNVARDSVLLRIYVVGALEEKPPAVQAFPSGLGPIGPPRRAAWHSGRIPGSCQLDYCDHVPAPTFSLQLAKYVGSAMLVPVKING